MGHTTCPAVVCVGGGHKISDSFFPNFLFSSVPTSGYLLVGLLAMLLALETAYKLQEIRAFVHFFSPACDPSHLEDDRLEILARDQLALATVSAAAAASDEPRERNAT